jgi:hypothetical protein
MRIATRCTHLPRLLSLVGVLLILTACMDRNPTGPQHPKLRLDESNRPVTVSSVITLFEKDGKTQTFTSVQKLRPVVRNGVAFSMVITDSTAQAAGVPTGTLTPILALQTGSLVGNYNQTVLDTTTGKVYKVVATGPMIYNHPIDYGYFATNSGVKIAETHYKWQPVTGGYALLAQKEVSYTSTGAVFATVVSTVTSPATYAMAETGPTISRRLGSLLHGAMCYFLPQTAYAQGKNKGGGGSGPVVQPYNLPLPGSNCYMEGAELGLAGVAVWLDATNPEVGIFAYSATLGYYEVTFAKYLQCTRAPARCTPWTNGCSGGGGTSWNVLAMGGAY